VRRAARMVAATFAVSAGAAPVAADGVCGDAIDQPIAVPWRDAGFDAAPGACPVADVALAVRGRALIDTPAFYGTLGGDADAAVRQRAGAHVAWGLAARAIDVTFIQNAVWTIVAPTVGPLVAARQPTAVDLTPGRSPGCGWRRWSRASRCRTRARR
jgi:hypothetical protein